MLDSFNTINTLLSVQKVFKLDTQLHSVDQTAVQQQDISCYEYNL